MLKQRFAFRGAAKVAHIVSGAEKHFHTIAPKAVRALLHVYFDGAGFYLRRVQPNAALRRPNTTVFAVAEQVVRCGQGADTGFEVAPDIHPAKDAEHIGVDIAVFDCHFIEKAHHCLRAHLEIASVTGAVKRNHRVIAAV